ncbi:YeeE/YedE family protein [Halovivax gelatinilyticus]|uniref:YeeE/YedE family protein n=1 Tax=Halovivax gelatinilyticus TaxID=2961597 RepID=UPI0020CA305F|nr:YeeE/YedE family protein [Halovivax gelatinilyticus]
MSALELLPLVTYGELFPEGITRYAVGGAFIGLGIAVVYLGTAIIAGASTFLETTLSYVSNQSRFQQSRFLASRDWRVVFTAGIVLGAAGYWFLILNPVWEVGFEAAAWQTDVQLWRLLAGGFLVGVGTRLGKGCTSGHGVCGVGSFSQTSIVNVATFVLVAIGTAQVVMAMGVQP